VESCTLLYVKIKTFEGAARLYTFYDDMESTNSNVSNPGVGGRPTINSNATSAFKRNTVPYGLPLQPLLDSKAHDDLSINRLQEYCQRNYHSVPYYTLDKSGSAHAPEYVATVQCEYGTLRGLPAKNQVEAKKSAAHLMYCSILAGTKLDPITSFPHAPSSYDLYKGDFYVKASKLGWPQPVCIVAETPGHSVANPQYTCDVVVAGVCLAKSVGRNKKEATNRACKFILENWDACEAKMFAPAQVVSTSEQPKLPDQLLVDPTKMLHAMQEAFKLLPGSVCTYGSVHVSIAALEDLRRNAKQALLFARVGCPMEDCLALLETGQLPPQSTWKSMAFCAIHGWNDSAPYCYHCFAAIREHNTHKGADPDEFWFPNSAAFIRPAPPEPLPLTDRANTMISDMLPNPGDHLPPIDLSNMVSRIEEYDGSNPGSAPTHVCGESCSFGCTRDLDKDPPKGKFKGQCADFSYTAEARKMIDQFDKQHKNTPKGKMKKPRDPYAGAQIHIYTHDGPKIDRHKHPHDLAVYVDAQESALIRRELRLAHDASERAKLKICKSRLDRHRTQKLKEAQDHKLEKLSMPFKGQVFDKFVGPLEDLAESVKRGVDISGKLEELLKGYTLQNVATDLMTFAPPVIALLYSCYKMLADGPSLQWLLVGCAAIGYMALLRPIQGFWKEHVEKEFRALFSLDVGKREPEKMKGQAGGEEKKEEDPKKASSILDIFAGSISGERCASVGKLLALTVSGFTLGTGHAKKVMDGLKLAADFPRVAEGAGNIIETIVKYSEWALNKARSILGYESVGIFSSECPTYDAWLKQAEEVINKAQKKTLVISSDNYDLICKLIQEGLMHTASFQHQKVLEKVKYGLMEIIRTLHRIKAQFDNSNVKGTFSRPTPLCIKFIGSPGVGKSYCTQPFITCLLALVLPEDQIKHYVNEPNRYVYTREWEQKFWDGYTGQWVTIFDDFNQAIDAAGMPDNEMMDIIRCYGDFTHVCHMADISQKGNTTFMSRIIIATTNQPKVVSNAILDTRAVDRRFDLNYRIVPHPDFAKNEKDDGPLSSNPINWTLDKAKLAAANITTFDSKVIQFIRVRSNGEMYGGYISYDEVIRESVEVYRKHEKKGEAYKNYLNDLRGRCIGARSYAEKNGLTPSEQAEYILRGIFGDRSEEVEADLSEANAATRLEIEEKEKKGKYPARRGNLFTKFKGQGLFDWFRRPKRMHLSPLPLGDIEMGIVNPLTHPEVPKTSTSVDHTSEELLLVNPILDPLTPPWWERLDHRLKDDLLKRFRAAGIRLEMVWQWVKEKGNTWFFNIVQYLTSLRDNFERRIDEYQLRVEQWIRAMNDDVSLWIVHARSKIDDLKSWFSRTWTTVKNWISQFDLFTKLKSYLPWIGIALTALIGTGVASYYMGSKSAEPSERSIDELRPQGAQSDQWDAKKGQKKKSNIKVKAKGQVKDDNTDQLLYSIHRKNSFAMVMPDAPGPCCSVLFVRGRILMLPLHIVNLIRIKVETGLYGPNDLFELRSVAHADVKPFLVPCQKFLNAYSPKVFTECDIALVDCGGSVPDRPDISSNFITRSMLEKSRNLNIAILLRRGNEPPLCTVKEFDGAKFIKNLECELPVEGDAEKMIEWTVVRGYAYSINTADGDCGAPVLLRDNFIRGHKIIGIHTAGDGEGVGFASSVTMEDLHEALEEMITKSPPFIGQVKTHFDINPNPHSIQIEATPTDRPVPGGGFEPLYSVPSAGSASKTQIKPSQLFEAWGPHISEPAVLRKIKTEDGLVIDPWEKALERYRHSDTALTDAQIKILEHACRAELNCITQAAPKHTDRSILTFEQACQGLGDHLRKIPLDTSPGYPYVLVRSVVYPGKTYWLHCDTDGNIDFEKPEAKLLKLECQYIIDQARKGVRLFHIYQDALKDERRGLKRVANVETRFISGSPLALLIVFRMMFGQFMILYQEGRIFNGSAIGMNPHSIEWSIALDNLLSVGKNLSAGDYIGLDSSTCATLHYLMLHHIVNPWYDDGPENALARNVLIRELTNSRHIIDGIVYEWFGKMPSGNPLTALWNTIYIGVAKRYVYAISHTVRTAENIRHWTPSPQDLAAVCTFCYEFDTYVKSLRLGDDHVISTHPKKVQYMNMLLLAHWLPTLGMEYTDANKEPVTTPFVPLNEVTFLKRRWRFDPFAARYIAPLELKVVLEFPYWTKKGSNEEEIMHSNFDTAMHYLSMHDQATWDLWAPQMTKAYHERTGRTYTATREILLAKALAMDERW